jgi:Ring finger domain
VRNQRRREEEVYRKEMEHHMLDSLPVVRYSTRLQSSIRRAHLAYDPEAGIIGEYPRTYQVEPMGKIVENNRSSDSAVIGRSTINRPSSSDNTTIVRREEDYSKNEDRQKSKDVTLTCSVCTDDFAENDTVRILPCGHIHHRRCIDPWLLRFGGNCPMW